MPEFSKRDEAEIAATAKLRTDLEGETNDRLRYRIAQMTSAPGNAVIATEVLQERLTKEAFAKQAEIANTGFAQQKEIARRGQRLQWIILWVTLATLAVTILAWWYSDARDRMIKSLKDSPNTQQATPQPSSAPK